MNVSIAKSFLFFALMVLFSSAQAQGVYVTRGEKGAVFSDKPQLGSKEVTLPPLTIVAPTPVETRASRSAAASASGAGDITKPELAGMAYRSFAIVSPENEGSVVANTAVFEVRVAIDPPLQLGERHSIVVSINGRRVGERYTATEFMIPPEFWGDVLPPPNQSMQLDASIIDGNGQVLKKAAPVRFYLRHATIYNRPGFYNHPGRPLPLPAMPPPKPPVKPKPAAEPSYGSAIKR